MVKTLSYSLSESIGWYKINGDRDSLIPFPRSRIEEKRTCENGFDEFERAD